MSLHLLRNKHDIKIIIFLTIITASFLFLWLSSSFSWLALFFQYLMIITVPVIAHNHLHTRVFAIKWLNVLLEYWLSCFYGLPIFFWLPTHNIDHHHHNNNDQDSSCTYQHCRKHNLWGLLSYPLCSGLQQIKLIWPFLKMIWQRRPKKALYFLSQALVLIAFNLMFLWLNWQKAILIVFIPQQIALYTIQCINYMQHAHLNHQSIDHSRNFTGKYLNFLLLNNGYHTVHHHRPGAHWSSLPSRHEKIAVKLDPALQVNNFFYFFYHQYLRKTS